MLRNAFHAITYWVPALIICLAIGARAAAPFPYGSTATHQILTESLVAVAHELQDKSTVYVTVDGSDPSADFLTVLNSRTAPTVFAPGKPRSLEVEGCRMPATHPGMVVVSSCLQDNFLSADLVSMPLWHVALVRVTTVACTAELVLVQGNAQWHVMSQRTSCSR
jgi:hypothetical protein